MTILDIIRDPPKWLIGVGSALGTALFAAVAAIWLSYGDFRGKRLEQNSAAAEQTVQASVELKPMIDKFITLSKGIGAITSEDRAQLTKMIRQAYDKAEDVRNRLGGLDEEYSNLAKALVELKEGADNMTGPIDGKQFFLAYSRYIVADEDWRRQVQRRQNSYIASFRL